MNFARTIKQLREKYSLTQQELAHAALFKANASISNFETGRQIPKHDAIVRISAALNISPLEFYLLSCEPEDIYALNPTEQRKVRNILNKLKNEVRPVTV